MAFPIAAVLVTLGAVVGWALARQSNARPTHAMMAILVLPALSGAEHETAAPRLRDVSTSIEIDALPERVWPNVIGFSELPPPSQAYFRLGIAYPMRARIHGEGVGAVRHCEFSTGPFVEPITTWDPPRRLAFDVASQPPSMSELSPYKNVKAAHLEGYMVSKRGEFRLVALPNGRTRLEGSTWYTLSIFPEEYWTIFGEALLHSIHGRVLEHIKGLSEAR
ncbi:MAG TPA: SRPBCC family protein [Labilithrix sp.]|nr:SRPBCC family protein [Labilithrix sp.]